MTLKRITLEIYAENCYIYHNDKECIIFDPGSEYEKIKSYIESHNLSVSFILLTHGHSDHIGAVADLKKFYNVKVLCHKDDLYNVEGANDNIELYGLDRIKIPEIDGYVTDGEIIDFNSKTIKVIHTPGHSKGSVCYYIEDDKLLISGDTLFYESIGRSDFTGGSHKDLVASIKNKLYSLPDDTLVFPGHGGHTTIGHEKIKNLFV